MAATVCPLPADLNLAESRKRRIISSKRRRAVQHQVQQPHTGPHLTSIDLFCGSDLPERSSPTSMRLVCIQGLT